MAALLCGAMSFNFEWPQFSEAFYDDAREMLAQVRCSRALHRTNKGTKPPIIADRIEVKELNMGTIVSPAALPSS